ncbi:hypothetical protein ILUMI_13655 [Ignelater luminosus]|uniref:Cytochrome P450 n=1 Tax=Ignelater luminosus TaxID=2038154 RepID=A0A8K0CXE2_IGNLU|nr:hypothetical protein ILUMI_13655 [Ignelater luminosus]
MALFTTNIFIDILLILVTIFVFIKFYFTWSFSYWNRKGVETLPPSFPLGNATELFLRKVPTSDIFINVYNKMKQKDLKYCGFYFLTQPNFVLVDPELIKVILTKDFQYFTDRRIYANEETDPLSTNVLTLDGSKWKVRRSKISPAVTSGKMKMMFETLFNCTKELTAWMNQVAENQEVLDTKEILGRFTTDVIVSCGFGIECNSLKNPNSDFRKYGKKILGESPIDQLKNLIAMLVPKVFEIIKIPVMNTEATTFFMNIVKETIKYREENNVTRKDFLDLLIQLKHNVRIKDDDNVGELKSNDSEQLLTVEQIAAEAYLFFAAGFETSSTTLTFCFYELASNPDVQEKLRNEIKKTLANYNGELSYDAVMEMSYMDKCINETLRKYPPFPTIGRICTKNYKVPDSNVVIEKGTAIVIPISGIHYCPEYYPEPEKFDPERFSPENKSKRHHYTWLPFGEGPRNCIGMRFGLMQVKVGLAVLLKDYKFTVNSRTQTPLIMDPASFISTAKGGIWLNVVKI